LALKGIISEFSGTIIKIDENSGDLIIREAGGEASVQTLVSPVDEPLISAIMRKSLLKRIKMQFWQRDGLGKETEGELLYLRVRRKKIYPKKSKGKVILVRTIDRVALFKAIGLDAGGIVTENLENADFAELTEKKTLKHRS